MEKIISKSVGETWKLAEKVAQTLKGGDILGLVGDLGGGKTTFTKGLAKALDIKDEIQSPTFTLIKEYIVNCQLSAVNCKLKELYHLDMYRINSEKEAKELGLEELFSAKDAIFVVEWADRIKNLLPKRTKFIKFDFVDETTRKISLK